MAVVYTNIIVHCTDMIKVITFNILSSELATPRFFPDTQERYLDANYRFPKLIDLLDKYILDNYIICFQEVSSEWNSKLGKFFELYGYGYNFVEYDMKLGVCICYPKLLFNKLDSHNIRIGEEISKSLPNTTNDQIISAKNDKQRLLILKLEDLILHKNLFIITYHMPCKFTQPTLMETHVLFCMKVINELVDKDPVIFVGDFNSKHNFNEWNILAKGIYKTDNSKEILKLFPICLNHFNDSMNEENRKITCYNQPNKETFIIDHVFYRNIKLIYSDVIHYELPIPSADFPSDHFPLIAHFEYE